jgi:cytidyltransferase-like protein
MKNSIDILSYDMISMNHILSSYNPDWNDCDIRQFHHALSNRVFMVRNNKTNETVIVREYIIKPTIDYDIIQKIGDLGHGPKILFRCETGTVEEFIPGRKMSYQEMVSDNYSPKIALQMRKLHDAGFAHLDLHHNNMIIDDNDNVRLIDFEYFQELTEETRKLDIANHFCEWMYDYDTEDWFKIKRMDDNRRNQMIYFIAHYLGEEPSAKYMNEITETMNVSHIKWMDWALTYYANTGADVYMKYANERATVSEHILDRYGKTVYVDGTFDLLHSGHIALLKKARSSVICKKLIVGVMSDKAVESYKRIPIQNSAERGAILKELAIVDDVVIDAPFEDELTADWLDKHKIDIVVYGGDPKLGTSALGRWQHHYRAAIARGIMKPVEYTDGYSTSDIIGRISQR